MTRPVVLIFHRPAAAGEPALVRFLAEVREELVARQARMFRAAGAMEVRLLTDWHEDLSFGEVLRGLAPHGRGGLVVLGSGAVPRLRPADARALVAVAAAGGRVALTNNRYSSDVCAIAEAATLATLPSLDSDNALPRWLEERAGYGVSELPGRDRLALDLDTPLDVALAALAARAPAWLIAAARAEGVAVPRHEELRGLAADPYRELLVFGRSGSATLRWLERNVRCRVRFLAEERGLRASSPLAIAGGTAPTPPQGQPRATLGLLLDDTGAPALADIVASLADGAVIDSRVLLAHRLGADESAWPSAADRFASDLLRPEIVADQWLAALTGSAVESSIPIVLGAHTLVGPGLPLLLGPRLKEEAGRAFVHL